MDFKKPGLSLMLTCGLLSACTHSGNRVEQSLQNWVGKHPDQLVEQWGAPRSVYTMEKGSKVLTFEASESYSRTLGYYRRPEIYTATENCKVSFFTDATQKTIEKFSYSGSPSACYEIIRSAPDSK